MLSVAHTLAEALYLTMEGDTSAERPDATMSHGAVLDIPSTHIRRRLTTITRQTANRRAPREIAAAAITTTHRRLSRDADSAAPSRPALAPRGRWRLVTLLEIAAGTNPIL